MYMYSYGQPYTMGVAVALQQARYLIFYRGKCMYARVQRSVNASYVY